MDAAVDYIKKNKLEFDLVAGGETAEFLFILHLFLKK